MRPETRTALQVVIKLAEARLSALALERQRLRPIAGRDAGDRIKQIDQETQAGIAALERLRDEALVD